MTPHRETPTYDEPALERPAEAVPRMPAEPEPQGSFLELLSTLSAWKGFILKFVFVAAVVAAAVALLWPKSYTVMTKIMPPQQSQSSLSQGMLGELEPLAATGGEAGATR